MKAHEAYTCNALFTFSLNQAHAHTQHGALKIHT